jgi:hypothetical protein
MDLLGFAARWGGLGGAEKRKEPGLVDPCSRSTTFYVEFETDLSRAEPAARGLARCRIMSDLW